MHTGKSYKLSSFLFWTRRNIYRSILIAVIAVVLYQLLHIKFVAIPWTVVALLGTATAFTIGFKNVQTYNRSAEAAAVWGAILNNSRAWGIMIRDFLDDNTTTKELIYRQLAWVTALRYQMRCTRAWETLSRSHNNEFKKFYTIPEMETPEEEALATYLSPAELQYITSVKNKATQLISLQSIAIKKLYGDKKIESWKYLELQKSISNFLDQQGKSERIKNYPYPRQYATVNSFFVQLFCWLLPFGMLSEFDKLNEGTTGYWQGNMVWLLIPFSILISWVYTSLEQVGESTENPFEGNANDIPLAQINRTIEIDLREVLGEKDLPPALQPENDIIL